MSEIVIPRPYHCKTQKDIDQWVTTCFGPDASYDGVFRDSVENGKMSRFRVKVVVYHADHGGRMLLVRDGYTRIQIKDLRDRSLRKRYLSSGKTLEDWIDGYWELPTGQLNPGESFEDCARRCVKERTGWDVKIWQQTYLLHHSEDPQNPYIMPVYDAGAVSGPEDFRADGASGMPGIGWFTRSEIDRMYDADLVRGLVLSSVNSSYFDET